MCVLCAEVTRLVQAIKWFKILFAVGLFFCATVEIDSSVNKVFINKSYFGWRHSCLWYLVSEKRLIALRYLFLNRREKGIFGEVCVIECWTKQLSHLLHF